jgi:hypothetical protein
MSSRIKNLVGKIANRFGDSSERQSMLSPISSWDMDPNEQKELTRTLNKTRPDNFQDSVDKSRN